MNSEVNKNGFTLVELMVVAIIVAILAAVAVPLMSGNKKRAVATEAIAAFGVIDDAAKLYCMEYGTPPSAFLDIKNSGIMKNEDLDGTYFNNNIRRFSWQGGTPRFTKYGMVDRTVTIQSRKGESYTFQKQDGKYSLVD